MQQYVRDTRAPERRQEVGRKWAPEAHRSKGGRVVEAELERMEGEPVEPDVDPVASIFRPFPVPDITCDRVVDTT